MKPLLYWENGTVTLGKESNSFQVLIKNVGNKMYIHVIFNCNELWCKILIICMSSHQ